jgi:superoxide reductase
MSFGELLQTADWKTEKHVPVIECADVVTADEFFDVTVSLGKEVAHPNTTEHHISYITVFFKPEGAKNPHQVGHFEFSAHGESVSGPNQGPVYTFHGVTTKVKTSVSGTLHAIAFCNIHGLWQAAKEIKVG